MITSNQVQNPFSEYATIMPLGDTAMLVRFSDRLTDQANQAAVSAAQHFVQANIPGVLEITPNLVSVLLRYNPEIVRPSDLSGEIRICLSASQPKGESKPARHEISATFEGPDLIEVARLTGMSVPDFVARHNATPLRVLATGFAPGFVYCGMHADDLVVERRKTIHSKVPAGSILFAAGQTAICATSLPTGWHVIGHTDFANFDPSASPPSQLAAGDFVQFVEVTS